MTFSIRALFTAMAVLSLVAAGCGSDGGTENAQPAISTDALPTVAVTTNILGDVVENIVGETANVVTIMPVGADPHDFQASAQQVAQIGDADVLITNGADFEEGLLDVAAFTSALSVDAIAAVVDVQQMRAESLYRIGRVRADEVVRESVVHDFIRLRDFYAQMALAGHEVLVDVG